MLKSLPLVLIGLMLFGTSEVRGQDSRTATADHEIRPRPFGAKALPASRRAAIEAAADYSAKQAGRAVLVVHDGDVVFERTEGNWKPGYPHALASGTKSFSGVLAAFALQDGLFTSWDERAADTLVEWRSDPRKSQITLRHLLSLSSGLDPGQDVFEKGVGALAAGRPRDAVVDRLLSEPGDRDFFAAAIKIDATAEPGAAFRYGPSHFYAFGAMLEAKLKARAAIDPSFPADVLGYMEARIFRPLQISVGRFGKDAVGHPNLPGGAALAPREWARFGEFVRKGGVVREESGKDVRLLRADLLAECFRPSPANARYGMTWWLPLGGEAVEADVADGLRGTPLRRRDRQPAATGSRPTDASLIGPDGLPLRIHMAAGLGKQRLYVVPALGLVVVRFAAIGPDGRRFEDDAFLRPIIEAFRP